MRAMVPSYFARKSHSPEEGLMAEPLVTNRPEKAATLEHPTKHKKVLFHFLNKKKKSPTRANVRAKAKEPTSSFEYKAPVSRDEIAKDYFGSQLMEAHHGNSERGPTPFPLQTFSPLRRRNDLFDPYHVI